LLVAALCACSDGDDDDGASGELDPVDACIDYKNAVIDKDFECYSSSGFYDDVGYWCAVTRGCDEGQPVAAGLVQDCVAAIGEASCTEYAAASYDGAPCDLLWDELDCQPI
jgi:hypothetical protein